MTCHQMTLLIFPSNVHQRWHDFLLPWLCGFLIFFWTKVMVPKSKCVRPSHLDSTSLTWTHTGIQKTRRWLQLWHSRIQDLNPRTYTVNDHPSVLTDEMMSFDPGEKHTVILTLKPTHFLSSCLGVPSPVLLTNPQQCPCRQFRFDPYGDHIQTCRVNHEPQFVVSFRRLDTGLKLPKYLHLQEMNVETSRLKTMWSCHGVKTILSLHTWHTDHGCHHDTWSLWSYHSAYKRNRWLLSPLTLVFF